MPWRFSNRVRWAKYLARPGAWTGAESGARVGRRFGTRVDARARQVSKRQKAGARDNVRAARSTCPRVEPMEFMLIGVEPW